jgi:hypothetical protein
LVIQKRMPLAPKKASGIFICLIFARFPVRMEQLFRQ